MSSSFEYRKEDGELVVDVKSRGFNVLQEPMLNKGTAFSAQEREDLNLAGIIPPVLSNMETQLTRAYTKFKNRPDDMSKNLYLTSLHDTNSVLFYRLVATYIEEVLPYIYAPVIAMSVKQYSGEYRRPRGVFLNIDRPDQIETALDNTGLTAEDCDVIVVTDSEQILGIGDWGVGGVNICIGKLSVYTAAGGIHPSRGLPVVLDVGTNNESLLNNPHYVGLRRARVRGDEYDAFIDRFVNAVRVKFPKAMLHWEDFGTANARRILDCYRPVLPTFNDDQQGTGAVALAAALSAINESGIPMQDHRIAVFGAGTAGTGIADQLKDALVRSGLTEEQALERFYAVDMPGLLTTEHDEWMRDFQKPYARDAEEVKSWDRTGKDGKISLADVIAQAKPTILIGCSTQAGAFTKEIIQTMAVNSPRPIVMPLSNPTSLIEVDPGDVIRWTNGKALVATGSPFPPTDYEGVTYHIGQSNNALVFPGIGVGSIVSRARHITDDMLYAAAEALANCADLSEPGASILPPIKDIRSASRAVAIAVAQAAVDGGENTIPLDGIEAAVDDYMWSPEYAKMIAV